MECEEMRPMSALLRSLLVIAVFALSAAATGGILPHVLYGKRIAGHVVDSNTGQPIAGAHVAFVWESGIIPSGFTGHNSRDICYHAAAAVTDQQGRFEIAPWKEWSTFDVDVHEPTALVYARQYMPRQIPLREGKLKPPIERANERYLLQVFTGTVDQRLDAMWRGIANHSCSYGGESQRSLFPMLKAIYQEARNIASTDEQRKQVHGYAAMAARAAIAPDPNGPANVARVDQFIKEELQ
jgi:hypothetical protein